MMGLRKTRPLAERFWSKVDKRGENDCWPWMGATAKGGYGHIGRGRAGEGNVAAHRLSYEIANGPIPTMDGYHGACVMHLCDNPVCVNPAHLTIGAQRANIDDMVRKGRHTPICLTGEDNPRHKLNAESVRGIRHLHARGGHTLKAIARIYGVSPGNVDFIVRRKTWSHV